MSLVLLAGAATTSFGLMGLSALTIVENAHVELAVFRTLDIEGCTRLGNCFYQNVTTPYTRSFVIDSRSLLAKPDAGLGRVDQYFGAFFLNPNQALVIIGAVPPCRYWSFIPYLWRSGIATNDNEFGDISFSSLNSGVNNFDIPSNVTKIAVVMTRNVQVYEREKMRISTVDPTVKVVPLWVTENAPMNAPVTYLLRTAFFIGEDSLDNYLKDPSMFSYRVSYNKIGYYGVKTIYPLGSELPQTTLGTKYIIEKPNPLEPSELPYQTEFDEYVKNIISRYTIIRELTLKPFLENELGEPYSNGQQCRDADINCQGDNPDTVYIASEQIDLRGNQRILIISPNHSTFGRAYYTSFNLYDDTIRTGIDSVLPEPGTRFYSHVFDPRSLTGLETGLYRLISRAYVQLPQNTAASSQTLILGKAYIISG